MAKKHSTVNRAQIHGSRKQKRSSKTTWIFILVLAVAIAAAWFFLAAPQMQTQEDSVLVTVNGEPLYQSQLDAQWNALPVQAKMQLDRETLLDQLIQERLLIQEAEAQDITVSDNEVQGFLEAQLQQTGTTEEQFAAILEQQGTSIEEVKEIYRRQLAIATLFEQAAGAEPIVNESNIIAFYEENQEQFYRDEQVTVRHILIESQENETPELVAEIEAELADGTDFCELVNEYTMDLASRDSCGEYTFPRGMMVPAFEEAGFDMDIGEQRTVQSQFGYHIIVKDADVPAGYAGLDTVLASYPGEPTVRQYIEQIVIQQEARSVFDNYVEQLEQEATIEYQE